MALLNLAEAEGRILLTLDKDFWQLSLQRRTPLETSGVILFRVHPATAENVLPLVRACLDSKQVWTGHISVITPHAIQMFGSGRR